MAINSKDSDGTRRRKDFKQSVKGPLKSALKSAGKDLKTKLRDLSPEQRDLISRRLRGEADDTQARSGPTRVARGETRTVPLSFAQERLWFADRLAPGDPALNITGGLRLRGNLSLEALGESFNMLSRRHETLRATFSETEAGPVQTVHEPSPVRIDHHDLRHLDAAAREAKATDLYARETRTGFDLERDLPLRVILLQLEDQEHLLVVSMHHMASDGWSIGLALREIGAVYAAHIQGVAPNLPEPDIRYGDFTTWQREAASDGALEAGLAYWREQLADPPPVLELAGDREVSDGPLSERTLDGATLVIPLDGGRKAALEALGRAHDTTLFVVLLATFMVLLNRLSGGRDDIVVGTPVSDRTRVETEGIISLFLNTLAMRARVDDTMAFSDLVDEVRRAVLGGLEHMNIPFERVVQALVPERSASRHPLFGTFFNFTPKPIRSLDLPGLSVDYEPPPTTGAQFPLELYVTERGDGLDLELLYHRARYSPELMTAFLEQYDGLLRQVVAAPGAALSSLDLVTSRARELLANPEEAIEAARLPSVVDDIAARIAETPREIALEYGDTRIDYATFGGKVAAVASALNRLGVTSGNVVAVSGPRSPGVVIAMSAVLSVGGVLLTLAPDLPDERRATMAREAGADWLVHVGVAPELGLEHRIAVDILGELDPEEASPETLADWLRDHPGPVGALDVPAYAFFTSGSTGTPKGVLGNHGGLAHFLAWQRQTFGLGPGDRCAQLVGLSFDVVLRDIFLPLSSGATLVIPEALDIPAGPAVRTWLAAARISHLHSVPSVMQTWLSRDDPADKSGPVPSLRCVFSAGEALTATLVGALRRDLSPELEIVNLYGPTETTLAKCAYVVPMAPRPGVQPLGWPMPGAQVLVLRPDGRRCGIGEPGEIAIRTPYRSLGYFNAPDEQAKRFVTNPATGRADDPIYRTGDLGVIMANGQLEYRGRLDHQVKIAGIRVEPGEVAATLQACEAVEACAVVARATGQGDTALVGYVVAAPGFPENAGRLREYLRPRLPGAMIPGSFVFLPTLPFDSNHKLDRSRLPAPDDARIEPEAGYVAPRDGIELRLVRIWETLLDVRPIGVTDNFFDLGGHSLLALRLLGEIKRQLGLTLPLPALFERPTVEHLADTARRNTPVTGRLVPFWDAPHRLTLFLVHAGGGMLWNYSPLVRHLAASVPVQGLAARGLDGAEPPHDDLIEMAGDYIAEIRAAQPEGPYLLAGHSLGGVIAFEMARQLTEAGQRVALLALLDTAAPALANPRDSDGENDTQRLLDMVRAIEAFTGTNTGLDHAALRDRDGDAQVALVVEALRTNGALPPGESASLVTDLLRVGKAHVSARRAYRPSHSDVPITLFRARETELDAENLGWSDVAGPIDTHWVDGDHVTMLSEAHVAGLARLITDEIERVLDQAGQSDA